MKRILPHRHESSGIVRAPADRVFARIDDHARLSSHMSESSWMMAGGRMETTLDGGRGQTVGSRISMTGRALGLKFEVEEVVTERNPPHRKVWETTGEPKLLVIDHYRMGFEIVPKGKNSMLRVFIEYALPPKFPGRWLGGLLGRYYASWCTQRMVDDSVSLIASLSSGASAATMPERIST
jgi:hypothetical protein